MDRHPVWRDAGPQMAPNCSRGGARTVSQGPGHWPPRRTRLSCFFMLSVKKQSTPGRAQFWGGAGRGWELVPATGPRPYELSPWAKGRGRRAALWRTAAFVIGSSTTEAKSSSAQYCPSSDGRGDRIERLLSLHELFTGSSAPLSGASSASRSRTVAYSAARRFQRRTPARSESR